MNGACLSLGRAHNDEVLVEAGYLVKGLYLYQLIGEEGTATGKLMVE